MEIHGCHLWWKLIVTVRNTDRTRAYRLLPAKAAGDVA
jgi:hypothetical protein